MWIFHYFTFPSGIEISHVELPVVLNDGCVLARSPKMSSSFLKQTPKQSSALAHTHAADQAPRCHSIFSQTPLASSSYCLISPTNCRSVVECDALPPSEAAAELYCEPRCLYSQGALWGVLVNPSPGHELEPPQILISGDQDDRFDLKCVCM